MGIEWIFHFTPSTLVLGNGPSWNPYNSHTPRSGFGPISWPCIALCWGLRSGTARRRRGGTTAEHRRSNRSPWNSCTFRQTVDTGNWPCIFHPLWPKMRHPIWNHKATLALEGMWRHSFFGTSLWAHHPQGIWKIRNDPWVQQLRTKRVLSPFVWQYMFQKATSAMIGLIDIEIALHFK